MSGIGFWNLKILDDVTEFREQESIEMRDVGGTS